MIRLFSLCIVFFLTGTKEWHKTLLRILILKPTLFCVELSWLCREGSWGRDWRKGNSQTSTSGYLFSSSSWLWDRNTVLTILTSSYIFTTLVRSNNMRTVQKVSYAFVCSNYGHVYYSNLSVYAFLHSVGIHSYNIWSVCCNWTWFVRCSVWVVKCNQ